MKRYKPPKHKNASSNKKKPRASVKKVKCPVWVATPNASAKHAQIKSVIERPFVSTVFFNPTTKSFGFPVPDRDQPHILGGLHARMKSKLFQKVKMSFERWRFFSGTAPFW